MIILRAQLAWLKKNLRKNYKKTRAKVTNIEFYLLTSGEIFPFFDARHQVSKRLALSDMSDCEVVVWQCQYLRSVFLSVFFYVGSVFGIGILKYRDISIGIWYFAIVYNFWSNKATAGPPGIPVLKTHIPHHILHPLSTSRYSCNLIQLQRLVLSFTVIKQSLPLYLHISKISLVARLAFHCRSG